MQLVSGTDCAKIPNLMNNILRKILNGEELIPEEWKQFLLNYHKLNTVSICKIWKSSQCMHPLMFINQLLQHLIPLYFQRQRRY